MAMQSVEVTRALESFLSVHPWTLESGSEFTDVDAAIDKEDIAQENLFILVRAVKRLKTSRGEHDCDGYLYRSIQNGYANMARDRNRAPDTTPMPPLQIQALLDQKGATDEIPLETNERQQELVKLLLNCTDRELSILVPYYLQGDDKTFKEIGAKLKTTERYAIVLSSRGLSRIRGREQSARFKKTYLLD